LTLNLKNKNNILITGGAGYIGSHIVEQLAKNRNNNIFVYDNLITGSKSLVSKRAKFIKGDINNKKYLRNTILKNNINSVIHLAAFLNVSMAETNKKKYFKNNIMGTRNIIESIKNSTVKNIIFSSSCSIYGNIKGPVSENKKPNPKGYYAFTKYEGEKIIKKFSKKYSYNYSILRYFNVAGASSSKKIGEIETSHGHLIKNLAIQSLKKKPIVKIFGSNYKTKDGTCIRDYIHVSDLAKIHIKALKIIKKQNKSFVVNCGIGKGYSVKQIIDFFLKIKKNTQVVYLPRRKGDVAQVFSSTKKFKKIFEWKAKFKTIDQIMLSSFNWEKIYNKTK